MSEEEVESSDSGSFDWGSGEEDDLDNFGTPEAADNQKENPTTRDFEKEVRKSETMDNFLKVLSGLHTFWTNVGPDPCPCGGQLGCNRCAAISEARVRRDWVQGTINDLSRSPTEGTGFQNSLRLMASLGESAAESDFWLAAKSAMTRGQELSELDESHALQKYDAVKGRMQYIIPLGKRTGTDFDEAELAAATAASTASAFGGPREEGEWPSSRTTS